MARLDRLLRWANVILVLLTFFAYLSPYIHPATFWLPAVLGLIYPVLLALNLAFVMFWLFQRDRYALFSVGGILLGWNYFVAFIGLSFSAPTVVPESGLRVLSYNVYGFAHYLGSGKAAGERWSETQLLEFYRKYEPDIWCLQEFPMVPAIADEYAQLIKQKTPLKYAYYEPGKALALFSSYPLELVKMENFGERNRTNGYLIADIHWPGQTVRIFNIHLQSNAVSRLAEEVAQNGQLQERETWLQIKGMLGRYRRTAALRADQAKEIRKLVAAAPHPLILCGDFNDVPLSYAYHQLEGGLFDGFRESGRGIGTTFRGSLPALRIDYILSSPELQPVRYQVLGTDRSDHYPVLSDLILNQTKD